MTKREAVIVGVADLPLKDGKVLAPMVKRSAQDANATSVISMDDIQGLMKGLYTCSIFQE